MYDGGGLRMTTAMDAQGCGQFLEQGIRIIYFKCTECALIDGEHKQCRWDFKLATISMNVYRMDVADNNDVAE